MPDQGNERLSVVLTQTNAVAVYFDCGMAFYKVVCEQLPQHFGHQTKHALVEQVAIFPVLHVLGKIARGIGRARVF